ncbi:MAG: hypothetical protein WC408_02595 [Candidatus Micrarchaeia archaeon]|jgi:uncharacterized membrane protein
MGIADFLFGKKKVPGFSSAVYSIDVVMHPFRIAAHKADYAQLDIVVENKFDKELLTSIVITLPKSLGFEQSALSHQKEIRVGGLGPKDKKSIRVQVWGTARTDPGSYEIKLFAMSHYRDYSYVLNEVKKTVELRVA